MLKIKKMALIVNLKSIIVTILALLSTYICIQYGFTADFPLSIMATAVIFPIVFSISGAYKRRETALNKYANMKALGRSIYLASVDWVDNPSKDVQTKLRSALNDIFVNTRTLFIKPVSEMREHEVAVYRSFNALSSHIRTDLREKGLASGECSRCNQYLSKMMTAFEDVKHIYQYRTPITLRAFSDFFIVTLPIVYGPHFAGMASDASHGLQYVMPIIFSVVLVALDNIQSHLENPFDQIGEDDIRFNVDSYIKNLDA